MAVQNSEMENWLTQRSFRLQYDILAFNPTETGNRAFFSRFDRAIPLLLWPSTPHSFVFFPPSSPLTISTPPKPHLLLLLPFQVRDISIFGSPTSPSSFRCPLLPPAVYLPPLSSTVAMEAAATAGAEEEEEERPLYTLKFALVRQRDRVTAAASVAWVREGRSR